MSGGIPERDWKVLEELSPVALVRLERGRFLVSIQLKNPLFFW